MMYTFSWFNKNTSLTFEDMKNLSKTINYTGLITPQTKLQPPKMKDERKHSILVSLYSIMKYETLVPNILSTPEATVLKY